MNLSAPTTAVFIVAVVVAIIALLAGTGVLAILPVSAFWLMTIAFVILAIGNMVAGL